jgi:ethanolamine transporter EutH
MDQIRLQSNRSFLLKLLIPYMAVITTFLIIMIIGLFIDYDNMSQNFPVFWLFVGLDIFSLLIILIAKFYKTKSFIFSKDKIEVYNKGQFKYAIETATIKTMRYYPFKWHYLITIYAGALHESGAWQIYIADYLDKKYSIGFLSLKDARNLQKMYPNLEIMYTKKR